MKPSPVPSGPSPRNPAPSGAPVTILRASSAEQELARQAVADVHGRTVDRRALRTFLEDDRHWLLVAVEEGRAVGSLNGYVLHRPYRTEPQFLLYEIDVREKCRRRGIGRALVERFRDEARAAGAYELWVLTNASNEAGMRLYESCGMVRENPDDVMWVLPLEPARGRMR